MELTRNCDEWIAAVISVVFRCNFCKAVMGHC